MDDYTLVKECVKGNPKAQRMLFDKFSSKMMTVCLRYTKDTSEAEDALQDGFIKIFNNRFFYLPYAVEIDNTIDSILGRGTPKIITKFKNLVTNFETNTNLFAHNIET
jgi:hypothetical protein